jgi:hypothetical protein
MAVKAALAVAGVAFAIGAVAFFLVALHVWLSSRLGAIGSASAIGGGLLVVALVLLFVASRPIRAPKGTVEQSAERISSAFSDALERLGRQGGAPGSALANPVLLAVGMAVVAGFALGRRRPRRTRG